MTIKAQRIYNKVIETNNYPLSTVKMLEKYLKEIKEEQDKVTMLKQQDEEEEKKE